ncbi:MAG: ribonuclease HI [Gammaproteobacteria bacterium]
MSESRPTPILYIYTDGACRGNPGPGGWGVLMRYAEHEKQLYGAEAHTTNNRMELMAVIQALKSLKKTCRIEITTDSQYVRNGVMTWLKAWKQKGWRNSKKEPVKNQDLWEVLDQIIQDHPHITWHWVKGHSGHPENHIADQLANYAIDQWAENPR